MKNRPGPVGTSCLTCRRRHKKCDGARPRCERCKKGNFECLGYDYYHGDKISQFSNSNDASSRRFRDTGISGDTGTSQTSEVPENLGLLFDDPKTAPALSSANPSASSGSLSPSQLSVRTGFNSPVSVASTRQPHRLSSLVPLRSISEYHASSQSANSSMSLSPNVSWMSPDIMKVADLFMNHYEKVISTSLFKPTYRHITRIYDAMAQRLQNIPSLRWTVATRVKFFDSVFDNTLATETRTTMALRWLIRAKRLALPAAVDRLTSAEACNQFIGSLELAMLEINAGTTNTYLMLKNYATTFLQIAFSTPSLWSSSCNSIDIPLAHVFVSPSFELPRYAMLDLTCAMSYGLPQLIGYDTSTPPLNSDLRPMEAAYGCPLDLLLVLAELNELASWNNQLIGPAPDWHNAEKRLKEWKPVTTCDANLSVQNDDSRKAIARLAVQESWRHMLLIYLYMAVCGASSNEPRVTASVQQVLQTISSVIQPGSQPVANTNFFMQLLIAGAFTPNENHRTFAKAKLQDGLVSRFCLLDIEAFVSVLDHLWHGAAANNRPIRWSDYIHSRQTIIPVERWL